MKSGGAGDIGDQIINPGVTENLTQRAIVNGMSEWLQEISLKNVAWCNQTITSINRRCHSARPSSHV